MLSRVRRKRVNARANTPEFIRDGRTGLTVIEASLGGFARSARIEHRKRLAKASF
jgi:hypothetical protein